MASQQIIHLVCKTSQQIHKDTILRKSSVLNKVFNLDSVDAIALIYIILMCL